MKFLGWAVKETVNTAITAYTGFNDRECNCQIYEGMKEKFKNDIQTAFLNDESIKTYITSDLTLRFLDGYKVRMEHDFSCYNENEQEAEGFFNYCVKGIQTPYFVYRYETEKSPLFKTKALG